MRSGMPKRVLALIAARAGSKGLRHKNVRRLAGKPLLMHAIDLARACGRRGEHWSTVVSTDSRSYARVARRAGATVPFLRPAHLATDEARLIDVVLHATDALAAQGSHFDVVVLLSATTPLTAVADVRGALSLFRRGRGVSVVSVCEERSPDTWRFELRHGRLCGEARQVGRRQAHALRHVLNGAIYVATPGWLHEHRQFVVVGHTLAWPMPKRRSLDIEDATDLAVAACLRARRPKR
jgi:N-acylneuraminate cytidylyltransferase/CMP-N,N'-diacetyllegionaminic acid synthase